MTNDELGSPGWSTPFFIRTTAGVSNAVTDTVAASTNAHSKRPSTVFSPKGERCHSSLQKLQRQVTRALKGLSSPSEANKGNYNPEILTSQKRQWARFHLESLNHKPMKEASRIFDSLVVVGLHPHCDVQVLREQFFRRKSEGSGKFRSALGHLQSRVEPNAEPQILFVYPPEKQLPLKHKDLVSFCFPAGAEVHVVERTPSMSEINEILIGQEHLKQSGQSFIFRLQVADSSTLYGCCLLAEELVQKSSRLVSTVIDKKPFGPLNRHVLTTRRCYCILSRFPYFELHFGVLNSIFIEERLERLTENIEKLDLNPANLHNMEENIDDELNSCSREHQMFDSLCKEPTIAVISSSLPEPNIAYDRDNEVDMPVLRSGSTDICSHLINKQMVEDSSCAVSPVLHSYRYESSESSASFYGSPDDDRNFRSDIDENETEEASSSGFEDSMSCSGILKWATANNCGSLRIICEYHRLPCPQRGSTVTFQPLGYLHPLEFRRPDETAINIAGSVIDTKSCQTILDLAEARDALLADEEATALSIWSVSCICGSLRLENVLTLFAGVLLEKQVIIISSNLGMLSAAVLSIIPLIRPYQWQSLLMPVLPSDMLDFLDAPVPYVVGVKNKTPEVQSKSANVILVDANKNQVKSPTFPHLPKEKELLSSLAPLHARLVGESYLGQKRPVYEYTDVQFEAAKGFLGVLREYLDSLCSNMRSHTITNVQSNDDKVSLLLKESFIESFPARERPFMKLFVDTQLFSVHTDLALSAFQKD